MNLRSHASPRPLRPTTPQPLRPDGSETGDHGFGLILSGGHPETGLACGNSHTLPGNGIKTESGGAFNCPDRSPFPAPTEDAKPAVRRSRRLKGAGIFQDIDASAVTRAHLLERVAVMEAIGRMLNQ